MTDWNNLTDAQRDIHAWACKQFPKRTSAGVFLKLYSEIGELIRNPGSPHEVADIFILLLDYCSMHNIQVPKALCEKMNINRERKWLFDEVTGLAQHIEGT